MRCWSSSAASATSCGVTIILIAHDIPLVMNLCDRIQVLNFGQLIAEGDPQQVRADPEVVAAYIGQSQGCLSSPTSTLPTATSGRLHGVSLTVRTGEAVAVIGSNGAGKTTMLRTISGLMRARSGSITYDGIDITHASTDRIVVTGHLPLPGGSAHLRPPQRAREPHPGRRPPPRWGRPGGHPSHRASSSRGSRSGSTSPAGRCRAASSRCWPSPGRSWPSRACSSSTSRRSASRPCWSSTSSRSSNSSSRKGLTILLVEQNVHHALDLADRAYVMESGRITARGCRRGAAPRPAGRERLPGLPRMSGRA